MLFAFLPRYIKQQDLTLRLLRISDGPSLSEALKQKDILKSCGISRSPETDSIRPCGTSWISFYRWLRKTFFIAYCIERKAQRIGFIALSNLAPGESAEISLVLFDPLFRGQGYGTRAFEMLSRNSFAKAFANTFVARVKKDNSRAYSFWRKLGFEAVTDEGDTTVMRWRNIRSSSVILPPN